MDLFNDPKQTEHQPLAYRMRPRTLEEFIGQDHIIGVGRLLRRAIKADQLSSIIFYGPPGTGKTTLAKVIANTTRSHFSTLNAVLSGVKELRYEIEAANERLKLYQKKTILFVDEVHRWNKSQQDALLPWVENGTFILIGATTENPYFEVNAALVSRSRLFQLTLLTKEDLFNIAKQALEDKERGYGNWSVEFEKGALEHLVDIASGDARSLLNALQLAVETSGVSFPPPHNSTIEISVEAAEQSIQKRVVLYDKEGDYHFDVISAFIKSIRGSDPDAALYWLARMLHSGEDPKFIFRRLLISATEDVGMADPQAIVVVEANAAAFDRIGLPEGRFHLAHATLYLSTAPKSNSTLGLFDALQKVESERTQQVPNHLKDPNRDAKGFGHGEGYLYPHAYKEHWVAQQYLPASLQGKIFYTPTEIGWEKEIRVEVQRKREAQLEATLFSDEQEQLTYSSHSPQWSFRTLSEVGPFLSTIRDTLFSLITVQRHNRILSLNSGYGLFVWEALRLTGEGVVVAHVTSDEEFEYLNHYASEVDPLIQPLIIKSHIETVTSLLEEGVLFEHIIGRNLFTRLEESLSLLEQLDPFLASGGDFVFEQIIPSNSSRLSHFITDSDAKLLFERAEESLYSTNGPSATNWNLPTLLDSFEQNGYRVESKVLKTTSPRKISTEQLKRWIERSYLPMSDKFSELNYEQLIPKEPLLWNQSVAVLKLNRG